MLKMVVWDPVAPREQTGVDRGSHDLVLQSLKGLAAFPVDGRHMDIEEAHQGVRFVFYARRTAPRGPVHASCDARI